MVPHGRPWRHLPGRLYPRRGFNPWTCHTICSLLPALAAPCFTQPSALTSRLLFEPSVREDVALRDRAKDIVISGGENISSIELEGVLYDHPE